MAIFVACHVNLWAQPGLDSLNRLLQSISPKETHQRIDAINNVASCLRLTDPDQAMANAQQALLLSKECNYQIGECDANITLGLLFWVIPESNKSIEHGMAALRISKVISYKRGMMEANLLLGYNYSDLNDYRKADSLLNIGLTLAVEQNHLDGAARACNALGTMYRKLGNEDLALQNYEAGLRYLKGEKNRIINAVLLNNIALHYIIENKSITTSKKYLEEALKISLSIKSKGTELQARMRIGELHKRAGEYLQALEQFKTAEIRGRELGSKGALAEIYQAILDIKSRTNWDDEARDYHAKYLQLKDTLSSLDRVRKIVALETRYETEKKNQAIKLLEQEKKIQLMWQFILIGGVLVTAITGFLIYRLQRSRTAKANQLLEIQQVLNEKLTEIDKLKSSFFTNISHEFRTPLTLIMAPLENELKKQESTNKSDNLILVKRNANRLLELVNQILDLSKLEAGKMKLCVRQGNLQQFLSVIVASFDSLAEHRKIEFKKSILVKEFCWYDPDKLEKIITNLLINAFKYTPPQGVVRVAIHTIDDQDLSIVISDTGPGIEKHEQAEIFSPYYQVRQSISTPPESLGTGLGLPIVKELVNLCNGSIFLKSSPGEGTTFYVSLPVNKESFREVEIKNITTHDDSLLKLDTEKLDSHNQLEPVETNPALSNDSKGLVLVVEDNIDLLRFISSILQNNNYEVLTSPNGKAALSLASKHIPNLIISDLMMPEMDGIELSRLIKNDERTCHVPVILLTARHESNSRIEGLKTGADDYITKPFSTDELLVRIKNLIESRKRLAQKFRERILISNAPIEEISLDEKFLLRVIAIIELNIGDFAFSVEKLASELNMSRTQLLRKIKALMGISTLDLINDIRLKRAGELIRQKVDTLAQIGYLVGFNDQSYFTRRFKKYYGETPSEYAQKFDPKKLLLTEK